MKHAPHIIAVDVIADYRGLVEQWAAFWQQLQDDWEAVSMTDAMGELMGGMQTLHADYFASQSGPDGEAWAALSPATIAAKGHDVILVDTDRLRTSLAEETPDSIREIEGELPVAQLIYGTAVPYSIYHNADTGREHIGLNDDHLDDIVDVVLDSALDQWEAADAA